MCEYESVRAHYSNITMSVIISQTIANWLLVQLCVSANIKQNTKARLTAYWPFKMSIHRGPMDFTKDQ